MPKRHLIHRVPHTARQMFDLVADVERYGEFVPGCREMKIISREDGGSGIEDIQAEMKVGHRLIEETVVCHVKLDPNALAIRVDNASKGPLRRLDNDWVFRDLDDGGSEIEFDIDFALRNRALGFVVGGLFDRVFLHLVESFEARADEVYA